MEHKEVFKKSKKLSIDNLVYLCFKIPDKDNDKSSSLEQNWIEKLEINKIQNSKYKN